MLASGEGKGAVLYLKDIIEDWSGGGGDGARVAANKEKEVEYRNLLLGCWIPSCSNFTYHSLSLCILPAQCFSVSKIVLDHARTAISVGVGPLLRRAAE